MAIASRESRESNARCGSGAMISVQRLTTRYVGAVSTCRYNIVGISTRLVVAGSRAARGCVERLICRLIFDRSQLALRARAAEGG